MKAKRSLGLVLVCGPSLASALAARILAAHAPPRLARDFAQPLVVATNWGDYGFAAFGLLAGGVALSAFLLACALVRLARDPRREDRAAIFAGACIGLLAAAAWPFVFSSDVYAYAAYGVLANRGLDPARIAPSDLHDMFLDAARWQWQGPVPVDIYGPGMLAIARALVAAFGGAGIGPTLTAFRIVSGIAFAASVALLDRALAAGPRKRHPLLLAAYALNPVVLWGAAEGHNDAVVALGLAAAAALGASGRLRSGGLLAGLLPAFKATGVGFAFGYVLEAARTRRVLDRTALVATAFGFAVASAITLPSLTVALGAIRAHGKYVPAVSPQGILGLAPALALATVALFWGLRHLGAGDARGYAWLGIAALLALPNAYPWYALWIVPCALAARGGAAATALWLATIPLVLRYLPDAAGTLSGSAATLAAAATTLPLLCALAEFVPNVRLEKDSSPT